MLLRKIDFFSSNLIHTVGDGMSRGVYYFGEGSLSQWLRDNVGDNWSGVSLNELTVVQDGVAQDWGVVGDSVKSKSVVEDVGVSKSVDVGDDVGVTESVDVGDDVGVTESVDVGDDVGVSKSVVDDVGVSKSVGGWDDTGGEDSLTLLPSGTGKSFLVSDSVSSTGLDDFRGLLDWGWSSEVGNNLVVWVGNWSKRKVIAGYTESIVSGGVSDTDFLSVGVDVGV